MERGTPSAFTAFGEWKRYPLFEFTGGTPQHTLYGWAQLDVNTPILGSRRDSGELGLRFVWSADCRWGYGKRQRYTGAVHVRANWTGGAGARREARKKAGVAVPSAAE